MMAGLLGIGGGTIIVPAFSYVFEMNLHVPASLAMHMASGSALCIMIFTCGSSVRAHFKQGSDAWGYFKTILPSLAIGIVIGANVADVLPTHVLKLLFGIFLLFVAFEMFFKRTNGSLPVTTSPKRDKVVVIFIGMMSGMLGIGGGTLLIPYLSRCNVPLRKITSIAAICSLAAGIIGTLSVMVTGFNDTAAIGWSTGYVYWPAVLLAALPSIILARLATNWAYLLPVKWLRIGFVIFLLFVSTRMIFF